MNRTIENILRNHYVDDNSLFQTHVSLIKPLGKFQFNRTDLEDFWDTYCKLIQEDENAVVGIAEKPYPYLPVLVDADIKIEETDDIIIEENVYNESHVLKVIEVYQSVLRNIVEDCTDENLTCVLLEKPMYKKYKNEKSYVSRGFHLMFPNLFLLKADQEQQLLPRVQDLLRQSEVFLDLGFADSGNVIDKASCTVPWLLYGSRKSADMDPYKATKVYDSRCEEVSFEAAFRLYKVYDNRERPINIRGNVEFYLPRILSIIPYGRETKELRHGLLSPLKEKIKSRAIKTNSKISVADALKESAKLLPLLDIKRCEVYCDWMTIGWCLFNIGEGCEDALDQWLAFSARCEDKYDEGKCISEWEHMVVKDFTLGTLKHFARTDNPSGYEAYKNAISEQFINSSLGGSHTDIANILYSEYGQDFVCASISSKVWYQFIGHKWEQIEEGVFLREKISKEVVEKYADMIKNLSTRYSENADKADGNSDANKIKQTVKLMQSLRSCQFKSSVMREALDIFYDKRFKEKLNVNPYLFAFKNGVYDLKLNVFRAGRPEDFISKCAPFDYQEYRVDDQEMVDVLDYLEKVFPDKSVRTYFLDQTSDVFVGGNSQKTGIFWSGEGDNAKSVTQTIIEKMLGPYAIKLATTVLTGKKPASGSAYADLARTGDGVRWAVAEEPDRDEMINTGTFKHLTGNDSYYARDLFEKGKDGKEIVPLYKLCIICLMGDTAVSLQSGVSVSIKKMQENQRVLAWDSKNDGLIAINQRMYIPKGEQECLEITLQDGRTIKCTPNHRFLTYDNKWIEAKDLIVNKTSLKMGVNFPKADDMFEDYDYKFLGFDLTEQNERLKAAALCRILGFVITDGTLNKLIYLGHMIDCENLLEDIKILTGKKPKVVMCNKTYAINLPIEIQKQISALTPIQKGGKVRNPMELPMFIFDELCPKFLIREVIAGMFGGDGCVPCVSKRNSISSLSLVASKTEDHVNSLTTKFEMLSKLLKDKFDINCDVSNSRVYKNYHTDVSDEIKSHVFLQIFAYEDILRFIETVGVRYCCHKNIRLTAISALIKFIDYNRNVNELIIQRSQELLKKYRLQNPTSIIYQLDKDTEDIISIFESTQHVENVLGYHHSNIRGAVKRGGISNGYKWVESKQQPAEILDELGCKTIRDAYDQAKREVMQKYGSCNEENIITFTRLRTYYLYKEKYLLGKVNTDVFMKQSGLDNFSVSRKNHAMPCFNLKVIHVKKIGKNQVYDINVDEPYSNFIAEGIVTHNCNSLPRMKYADKATWNRVKVLPFESTFCRTGYPETYEEQLRQKKFPMDPHFSKKIPSLIPAFAYLLLEHRKKLTVRVEPEKVLIATAFYRKQNDLYREFIEENIMEAPTNKLTLTELYSQFKEWFKDGFPGQSVPVKNDVREYFSKCWGEPSIGLKWTGHRIRTLDDDLEDGTAVILGEDDLVDYSVDGIRAPPS